jgi:hypothetical protein
MLKRAHMSTGETRVCEIAHAHEHAHSARPSTLAMMMHGIGIMHIQYASVFFSSMPDAWFMAHVYS